MRVNDVPAVIPRRGLWIDGRLVFLRPPPRRLPRLVMPPAEPVEGYKNAGATPARAVLAVVSAPGTNGGGQSAAGSRVRPLRHWLAWVVMRTARRPFDAQIGGFVPADVFAPRALARHDVSLIDARSGQFLLGFETK